MLRRNPTRPERVLWGILRRKPLGIRFERQVVVRGYIADFWCSTYGLVVEVDGPTHAKRVEYDKRRDAALAALGITTLRFSNEEVLCKTLWIREQICGFLEREILLPRSRRKYPLMRSQANTPITRPLDTISTNPQVRSRNCLSLSPDCINRGSVFTSEDLARSTAKFIGHEIVRCGNHWHTKRKTA